MKKLPTYMIPILIKQGRPLHSYNIYVKWNRGEATSSRSQVIAPSKIFKKAVIRNKVKRILRQLVQFGPIPHKPTDFLIIAKPNIIQTLPLDLKKELQFIINKISHTTSHQ